MHHRSCPDAHGNRAVGMGWALPLVAGWSSSLRNNSCIWVCVQPQLAGIASESSCMAQKSEQKDASRS